MSSVAAWNKGIHQLIGHLSATYFEDDPITLQYLNLHLKDTITGHSTVSDSKWEKVARALAVEANWADSQRESAHLHFVYLPPGACPSVQAMQPLVCGTHRRPGCLITGIEDALAIAMDTGLSSIDRTNAVKFLLHAIADGMQPMHVSLRSDVGGNAIILDDPRTSLHYLWDVGLLSDKLIASVDSRFSDDEAVIDLSRSLRNQVRTDRNRFEFSDEQLESGRFIVDMLVETAQHITCPKAYTSDVLGWIVSGTNLVRDDPAYLDSRQDLAVQQVIKAAVRVGQVLQHIAHSFTQRKKEDITRIAEGRSPISRDAHLFSNDNRYTVLADDDDDDDDSDFSSDEGWFESTVLQAAPKQPKLPKLFSHGVRLDELSMIRVQQRVVIVTSQERFLLGRETISPLELQIVKVRFRQSFSPELYFLFDLGVFPEAFEPSEQFLVALFRWKEADRPEEFREIVEDDAGWKIDLQVEVVTRASDRILAGTLARGVKVSEVPSVEPEDFSPESEALARAAAVSAAGDRFVIIPFRNSRLVTRESMLCRPLANSESRAALNVFNMVDMDNGIPIEEVFFVDPGVWDRVISDGFMNLLADDQQDQDRLIRVVAHAVERRCDLTRVLQYLDRAAFDPVNPQSIPRSQLQVINEMFVEKRPQGMITVHVNVNPNHRNALDALLAQEAYLVYIRLSHSFLISRVDLMAQEDTAEQVTLSIHVNTAISDKPFMIDRRVLSGTPDDGAWEFLGELLEVLEEREETGRGFSRDTRFIRAIEEADKKIHGKKIEYFCMKDRPVLESLQDGTQILTVHVRKVCKLTQHYSNSNRRYHK